MHLESISDTSMGGGGLWTVRRPQQQLFMVTENHLAHHSRYPAQGTKYSASHVFIRTYNTAQGKYKKTRLKRQQPNVT